MQEEGFFPFGILDSFLLLTIRLPTDILGVTSDEHPRKQGSTQEATPKNKKQKTKQKKKHSRRTRKKKKKADPLSPFGLLQYPATNMPRRYARAARRQARQVRRAVMRGPVFRGPRVVVRRPVVRRPVVRYGFPGYAPPVVVQQPVVQPVVQQPVSFLLLSP